MLVGNDGADWNGCEPNAYRRWAGEDDALLRAYAAERRSWLDIATLLGRTPVSVERRARRLGVRRRRAKVG